MTAIYTTPLKVVRATGIGTEVFDEIVGTGTGALADFDLDNGNIIASSYSLYYAVSGSNTMTALVETTDYVLSKDEGRIVLTTAGKTALGTKILYASYIHSPKMSDTMVDSYILAAEAEVERKTGNHWGTVESATEYFSGDGDVTYPTTDEPYATDYDNPDFVVLKYKGCVALTSVDFLTRGGATVTEKSITLTSVYLKVADSTVTFLNDQIPNGVDNVKIVYTHGYATVDPQIAELASYYTGLRVYAFITGGSYDDATGFTLGRKTVSIGEVYVNVREVARQFEARIEQILDDVGRKMDVM